MMPRQFLCYDNGEYECTPSYFTSVELIHTLVSTETYIGNVY